MNFQSYERFSDRDFCSRGRRNRTRIYFPGMGVENIRDSLVGIMPGASVCPSGTIIVPLSALRQVETTLERLRVKSFVGDLSGS